MAVVFQQLSQLGPNDLRIEIYDSQGNGFDPFILYYTFYGNDPLRGEWVVGVQKRFPVKEDTGKYYVGERLTTGFIPGSYYIQWVMRRTESSPLEVVKKQEFAFIGV